MQSLKDAFETNAGQIYVNILNVHFCIREKENEFIRENICCLIME